MDIPAARFKADCLKIMDEVARTGRPVVVTKHGKPIVQLVPAPRSVNSYFGHMKGTVTFKGDIAAPLDEVWSALSADEDKLLKSPRRAKARTRARAKA
jgi:prevent-host-death family protein